MNMDKCVIRMAQEKDKVRIMEIYAYARSYMAANGNPNEWKNNNPSKEVIDEDISDSNLYEIAEKKLQSRTSKMENIKSADHLTLQQRKVQIMKTA